MKGKVSSKNIARIISVFLVVLCLVGIVGFAAYFTKGFTANFQTFYLKIDGNNVMSDQSNIELLPNEPLKVDVKHSLSFVDPNVLGYSVTVEPIADFDFLVDGQTCSFEGIDNLSQGFAINYEKDCFTIAPKGNMKNVLQIIYPGREVELQEENIPDGDLIAIVVASDDGQSKITLKCHLKLFAVTGVTLDKEELEF